MSKKPERLGDAPIENEYVEQMNAIARVLDQGFNGDLKGEDRKTGFVLMVFEFSDKGRCNYISNANRDDVVTMMKQQIKRFEGQPDVKGRA